MEGETSSSATVPAHVTTLQTNALAVDRGLGHDGINAMPAYGTFAEQPPLYRVEPAINQPPTGADGVLSGQFIDRATIYSSLYDDSDTGTDIQPRQIVLLGHATVQIEEAHSNGWYDGCFTRSCVCDYTGRHVIPEYITAGSLYRGRVLGWKIFRQMTLPMVGDTLRILWTMVQLLMSIALLALSSLNYCSGRIRNIYNIVHLTLSVFAVLLASVDLSGSIVNKIIKCCSSDRYEQLHHGASIDSLADGDNHSIACQTRLTSDHKNRFSYVDVARLIIPELILFPIVICDVYNYTNMQLMNHNFQNLETTADWTSFIELLFSVCSLVIQVYIVRITLLAVMTYRVHTKRSLPKELYLTQDDIVGAGCDPTIRRNGLIYLMFLIFNVVTHMVNQIAMILAIGLKIHEYINDHSSKLYWFMIAAGYVLPIAGAWLFFSVTHFWLQEFAIGISVDYLGMLKLPRAACLFFPNHTPYEAQNKAKKILSHNKYDKLRQDYHALRNENPLAKAFYPFKSFSHTLMCLGYTAIQVTFVCVAAFSIQGKHLNMGVFLFVIITELLSNVYVVLVSLFWIIVGVFVLTAMMMLRKFCLANFCYESLSRGLPQPPVMTPQIRVGLQQVRNH